MTEKEKIQKQMLYDANYDTDLLIERNRAKDLCYEYNRIFLDLRRQPFYQVACDFCLQVDKTKPECYNKTEKRRAFI